jgi:hypothetical protein
MDPSFVAVQLVKLVGAGAYRVLQRVVHVARARNHGSPAIYMSYTPRVGILLEIECIKEQGSRARRATVKEAPLLKKTTERASQGRTREPKRCYSSSPSS